MILRSAYILNVLVISLLSLTAISSQAQLTHYGSANPSSGGGDCFTVTPNSGNQAGAVYNLTAIDLSNTFRYRCFVNLGSSNGGADGMAFVFRSNPTVIPVGDDGGSLGISNNGDSTLIIELDTWANGNNNDVSYDHICIMRHDIVHNGYNNLSAPVDAIDPMVNIEDGQDHELSIYWDAPTKELKVYFDCDERVSYSGDIVNNVFNGNPIVYYGVTAATGGATNLQTACFSPDIDLPDTLYANCGDTTLRIQLLSDKVDCSSIDADGSDFRLADSSQFNGTPLSVNFLGVLSAQALNCNNIDKSDLIEIDLIKPLRYGDYTLIVKKGNNQNTLSPFCNHPDFIGYDDSNIPEFTTMHVKVRGNIPVQIDDRSNNTPNPSVISVCVPQANPFPILKANSNSAINAYYWTFNNGDTIQQIDSLWANQSGTYSLSVVGPYGCRGQDEVNVYFPTIPEFVFDLPPYCDSLIGGDTSNLPAVLKVPTTPSGGKWSWEYDLGPPNGFAVIQEGDSILNPLAGTYKLIYTDTAQFSGIPGCSAEYQFELNRTVHPPESPLDVTIWGDLWLCSDGDESTPLTIIDSLLKPNFKAKPGFGSNKPYRYQWYFNQNELDTGTAVVDAIQPGFYMAIVQDQYGCIGSDTVELRLVAPPPPFDVSCEITSQGNGRYFWPEIFGATGYQVSYDEGITWEDIPTPYIDLDNVGQTPSLKVRAVFDGVCKTSEISDAQPCVAKLEVPNVLTPNQDGLNDVFYIEALELFPGSSLQVFDRWGMEVYQSSNYQNDWDAGDIAEGTYFYIVNINDGVQSVYKGTVTLLR